MPQIWLSYPELAAFLGCALDDARPAAIDEGWSRRQCSDGVTRVKLRPADAESYMRSCAEASTQIDGQVVSLRAILDEVRIGVSGTARSVSARPGVAMRPRKRLAG